MTLIFSPFIGFAIHGKVAEPGLITGLYIAAIPLCGLVGIVISQQLVWRRLPVELVEEWTRGKPIPTTGGPEVNAPARFANQNNWIEILPEVIAVSRETVLSMQGVSATMQKIWVTDQTGVLVVTWSDVSEWIVDTDSDGPDFYRLRLREGGGITVRRFEPDEATECELLDAVRCVGKVPLRLRCDVDCK